MARLALSLLLAAAAVVVAAAQSGSGMCPPFPPAELGLDTATVTFSCDTPTVCTTSCAMPTMGSAVEEFTCADGAWTGTLPTCIVSGVRPTLKTANGTATLVVPAGAEFKIEYVDNMGNIVGTSGKVWTGAETTMKTLDLVAPIADVLAEVNDTATSTASDVAMLEDQIVRLQRTTDMLAAQIAILNMTGIQTKIDAVVDGLGSYAGLSSYLQYADQEISDLQGLDQHIILTDPKFALCGHSCKGGEYVDQYCTASTPNVCKKCPADYFSVGGLPSNCTKCAGCSAGSSLVKKCDGLNDNVQCAACPTRMYLDTANHFITACKPCSPTCPSGTTFLATANTYTCNAATGVNLDCGRGGVAHGGYGTCNPNYFAQSGELGVRCLYAQNYYGPHSYAYISYYKTISSVSTTLLKATVKMQAKRWYIRVRGYSYDTAKACFKNLATGTTTCSTPSSSTSYVTTYLTLPAGSFEITYHCDHRTYSRNTYRRCLYYFR